MRALGPQVKFRLLRRRYRNRSTNSIGCFTYPEDNHAFMIIIVPIHLEGSVVNPISWVVAPASEIGNHL
jgi:hypothetical protein